MKLHIPAILLFVFCAGNLSAQSTAEEIETLMSTGAVTYAAAARFLLQASDTSIPDNNEAFNYATQQKWLPKKAVGDKTARLDAICLLLMRSFNIKGGLFYSITKSPHYAYRELVHKRIIQGRTDPAMQVSGEQLLFITGRVLSQQETGN